MARRGSGFFRRVGHALFPSLIPRRAPLPKDQKANRDLQRGKEVKAKDYEKYVARQRDKAERREQKENDRAYRQAWMERRLSRPGRQFYKNYEFFNNLPMMRGESEEDRQRYWQLYLENMVSGRHRRDSPSNPFWRETGISPSQFDWQEWRETMGYKGRK